MMLHCDFISHWLGACTKWSQCNVISWAGRMHKMVPGRYSDPLFQLNIIRSIGWPLLYHKHSNLVMSLLSNRHIIPWNIKYNADFRSCHLRQMIILAHLHTHLGNFRRHILNSLEGSQFTCLPWQCSPEISQSHLQLAWKGHYNDIIMGTMASQITSLTIVYSIVYSGTDQRKHQSSASLAFVRGIHQGQVNSPH